MANVITKISILHDSGHSAAWVAEKMHRVTTEASAEARDLGAFFDGMAGGVRLAHLRVAVETGGTSVRASATCTMVHATLGAADTITIGGRVLTWQVAAGNENEITIGADATADAAALAAAINANSELKGFLVATSAAAVVTITYWAPGREGNLVTLATSDAVAMVLSAARLGGGTGTQHATPVAYELGVTG